MLNDGTIIKSGYKARNAIDLKKKSYFTRAFWMKYEHSNTIKDMKTFSKNNCFFFKFNNQTQFWKTISFFMMNSTSYTLSPLVKANDVGNASYLFKGIDRATLLNKYSTEITNLDDLNANLSSFPIVIETSMESHFRE